MIYRGIHYFSYLPENIDYGYLLELPCQDSSNRLAKTVLMSTHNLCFEQKYEKISDSFYLKFSFFGGKIFNIFEWVCFRNECMFLWRNKKNILTEYSSCLELCSKRLFIKSSVTISYFHIGLV